MKYAREDGINLRHISQVRVDSHNETFVGRLGRAQVEIQCESLYSEIYYNARKDAASRQYNDYAIE